VTLSIGAVTFTRATVREHTLESLASLEATAPCHIGRNAETLPSQDA